MKKYIEFINEDIDYNKQLIYYARIGNLDKIINALNNGADINADNDNALYWASTNGHLKVVKYLVEHGANIHASNDDALFQSNNNNQLDVVKYLVKYIIKNEPEYLPKIIEYVPQEYKEKYPWLFAGIDHDLIGLKHVNEDTISYNNNLELACKEGNLDKVKKSIKSGANIHYQSDNPFNLACNFGHLNIVKYLVNIGADIHSTNHWGLKYAIYNKHEDVVKYLIEYILENEPEYLPKIIEYVPQEYKEKYPWLFAGIDHDLIGLKHNDI